MLITVLVLGILYGPFLANPYVFDDLNFFDGHTAQDAGISFFQFDLRWFSRASLGYSYNLFGPEPTWLRLGNVLLHFANSVAWFVLLQRLFTMAGGVRSPVQPTHLAFCGALIFAVHPVAVYGVAYLIQRSILMATFFTLLALLAYWDGLVRQRNRSFCYAVLFYFLAVYSKEQAVMAPAVALALTFWLRPPSHALFKQITLPFVGFAVIAVLVVASSKGLLGSVYEIDAQHLLEGIGQPVLEYAHGLGVLTQFWLFFKYLGFWLLPNPAWMSVDMREPFATSFWSWPYVMGAALFMIYGLFSAWLLLKRGMTGLLGLALLFPWLLFATEFSVVRVQEPFVLYRSYLWMGGLLIALPWLISRISPQRAVIFLLAVATIMVPLAWNRLQSFSSALRLWDDAAVLVQGQDSPLMAERIFYSRANALGELHRYQEAIHDYGKVIELNPKIRSAYLNRGIIYARLHQYSLALQDFNSVLALDPVNVQTYLVRGIVLKETGDMEEARESLSHSCDLKSLVACFILDQMNKH